MTTYLITGATGYIGGKLTSLLEKSGNKIYAIIKNQRPPVLELSGDGITFVSGDLADRNFSYLASLKLDNSVLIDLAWDFSGRPQQDQVQDHFLLAAAAIEYGAQRIVSLGTLFELSFDQGEVDEYSPRLGQSDHGLAKSLLLSRLEQLCEHRGASLLWPRVHYVYGEDFRSRSIFGKIQSNPQPFPLNPRDGRFDFINLSQLADMLEFLINSPSTGTVDVGSGNPISFREAITKWLIENGKNPKDYLPAESQTLVSQKIGTWPSLTKFRKLKAQFDSGPASALVP